MEFGPIWRAMLRNKGGYLLIALQIAVTMAIMVNAIAIMQERSIKMARPSGIDEANTFGLVSVGFKPDMDAKTLIQEDLDLGESMDAAVNSLRIVLAAEESIETEQAVHLTSLTLLSLCK